MKIKDIILWLFIFVIGSLIVAFILDPSVVKENSLPLNSEKIKSDSVVGDIENPDSLVSKCTSSFNECKEISELKSNNKISSLKVSKFEEISKAREFYKTWSDVFLASYGLDYAFVFSPNSEIEDSFPLVLFAVKVDYPQQGQIPYVLVCDKEGNLIEFSRLVLSC